MIKIIIQEKQKDKGLFFGGYIEIECKKISIGSNHLTQFKALEKALKIIKNKYYESSTI